MFFFKPHESNGFGLRWIVFTKVRALSCGQWVSQLHLLRKMAGIFRNSSIESSDPSSSCSKNSLKYGSVCACVFLLHWNLKNSWIRSMILFLLQEFWQTGEFQTCDKNTWYVLPDADRKWWKNRGVRFVLKGKSWGHLVTGFAEKYGKSQVQGHKKKGWIWVYVPIQWYPMNLMDVTSDTYKLWKMITVVLAILHAPSFFGQSLAASNAETKVRIEKRR